MPPKATNYGGFRFPALHTEGLNPGAHVHSRAAGRKELLVAKFLSDLKVIAWSILLKAGHGSILMLILNYAADRRIVAITSQDH